MTALETWLAAHAYVLALAALLVVAGAALLARDLIGDERAADAQDARAELAHLRATIERLGPEVEGLRAENERLRCEGEARRRGRS